MKLFKMIITFGILIFFSQAATMAVDQTKGGEKKLVEKVKVTRPQRPRLTGTAP